MSLKGSLQTVPLHEVLDFLSGTKKSGQLEVGSSAKAGSLWFRDGTISAVRVERGPNPVEAVFQLLRFDEGEFDFTSGEDVPGDLRAVDPSEGDVAEVLRQAEQRMGEWASIAAVVPSLNHRVTLVSDTAAERVDLDRSQWQMVVAIGEGRCVGDVIAARDLGEFEGCRAIKVLVESFLARIEEAEPGDGAPQTYEPRAATEPVPDLAVVSNPFDLTVTAGTPDAEPAPTSSFMSDQLLSITSAISALSGSSEQIQASRIGLDQGAVEEQPAAVATDTQVIEEKVEEVFQPTSELHLLNSDLPALGATDAEGQVGEPVAVAEPEVTAEVSSAPGEPFGGAAALQALLQEVAAQEALAEEEQPVDGLADRGPWTSHELASFDGWKDEQADAERPAPGDAEGFGDPQAGTAEVTAGDGDADERSADPDFAGSDTDEEVPAEEPINRGLLLKFLSSVRG